MKPPHLKYTMTKPQKLQRARQILDQAKADGITISRNGFGTVFRPSLAPHVLMEAAQLGNELGEVITANPAAYLDNVEPIKPATDH